MLPAMRLSLVLSTIVMIRFATVAFAQLPAGAQPLTLGGDVTVREHQGELHVSHWPASMDDDCRAVRVAQGYLPETAQFRPATWHRVK
jgi:hypothetical protein